MKKKSGNEVVFCATVFCAMAIAVAPLPTHAQKGEMPGWAPALHDAQVALVRTYIRKSFGNNAPPVMSTSVAAVRTASALRTKPYTAAELAKLPLK